MNKYVDHVIPPAPNLGFTAENVAELRACIHEDQVIGYALYNDLTATGGVYDRHAGFWHCWGPVSPQLFAQFAEACVDHIKRRLDGDFETRN
jgi:hypothetical protein